MPSRPVLIGRGLVTHTHQETRVHHPESEPTNPPQPATTKKATREKGHSSQQNNGSPRYGGHSGQETPGPIPNPEVKPASANGTAPDRMWESRTPPNILFQKGPPPWWPLLAFRTPCRAVRALSCPPEPLGVHSSGSRRAAPQPVAPLTVEVGDHAEGGRPGGGL
jgi:hypothetical protein